MDPAYYSALERAIQNAPMEHATAAGWQGWLRAAVNRAEVKEDELKWTTLVARLHDAAPNAGDRLTRETVQEIFEVNAVWVHTLSGEGLPEWEVRTLRGETVHATRSRAMEIYQQELAWGEQGVVVIRDNPARITVESYEDRQPDFARADFGIAAGDDGKLHWQCERFPHKRWVVDQDLFDRASAESPCLTNCSPHTRRMNFSFCRTTAICYSVTPWVQQKIARYRRIAGWKQQASACLPAGHRHWMRQRP